MGPVHHVAPVHHAVGYGVSNVANTVGIVHVAKREADAEPEADAAALYGAYGHHGLYGQGYGLGVGHRTYSLGYGHGYARYGYYGKRSAEAEPNSDADAVYGHGLYGLGHRTYSLGYGHGYGLTHGYSALQPW